MSTNTYELTYILDGVLSEEEQKDLVQRISKYISDNGGTVAEQEEWGARRLAYPIRKRTTGYYVNLHYTTENVELPARLERAMRINEGVLRFLTLRLDPKMIRHYEKRKAEGVTGLTEPVEVEEKGNRRRD